MKLKTKTDYCLRVLIYLQKNDKKVRIRDIADDYQISKNHLSVAVNKLSELNYVITTFGPKGGLELNPDVKGKKLGDLVYLLDDFNIVECFDSNKNTCNLDPNCKLRSMLSEASKAFIKELNKYTIEDLI